MSSTALFDNQHPALRRAYHPVCRSTEVPEGAVIRVRLLGEDWAVARIDGRLAALVDRCPHRGTPLSAGCVIDGSLQCPYHGFRYAPDGRCVLIPSQPPETPIPQRVAVPAAHSLAERYGLVWLAPEAPLTDIIEVPEWDDPAFVVAPLPDQQWSAGAAQMTENFLDLTHFPFVHLGTFGDPDDRVVPPYTVEREGLGFTCDYRHSTKRLADSMHEPSGDSYRTDQRRSIWWYAAPFSIRLRIEYFHEDVVLTILFFHQPVDATTTKLYCFDLRNDIADGRTTVEDTVRFQLSVANEDRVLLERIASKATPLDLRAEVHTPADRITVEMRRVLADWVRQA
jgi:vanillate O-demethylase monooxygenase subunit